MNKHFIIRNAWTISIDTTNHRDHYNTTNVAIIFVCTWITLGTSPTIHLLLFNAMQNK